MSVEYTPPDEALEQYIATTTVPARAGGEAAVGPSFIPQEHGGALSYGGIGRSASSAGSGAGVGAPQAPRPVFAPSVNSPPGS